MAAAITAVVIGVGDLVATGTDIYWLYGDMSIQTHNHHYPVLIGLALAELIMIASFIWLFRSIKGFNKKKAKKARELYRKQHMHHDLTPKHCNVNSKKVVVKPDYSKYEGLD